MNNLLLIGFAEETTLSHLANYMKDNDISFHMLDLQRLKTCRSLKIEEGRSRLRVEVDEEIIDFNQYNGFFCRFFYVDTDSQIRNRAFSRLLSALCGFLQTSSVRVINRPSAGASNVSKLVQLLELKEYGFKIPQSYILGSSVEARKRVSPNGRWISKGCSGTRTKVVVVDDGLYSKLDSLRAVPSQFQYRINGYDVRAHVIGDQVISLKIKTEAIDYRFALKEDIDVDFTEIDLPEDLKTKCLAYAHDQQLLFAGFDFKVDKDSGEWYVLETNPMPGYDFFDKRLNGKISAAISNLLTIVSEGRNTLEQMEPFISEDRRPAIII